MFRTSIPNTKAIDKCKQSAAEFFAIGMRAKLAISKSIILVDWRKPPVGWAKLNTDCLVLGYPRKARGGELIRDHNGDWVTGFSRSLGCTNIFMAELWALRNGLILAKDLNLNSLIVELDAKSVVQLMNNDFANLLMELLLTDYKTLARAIPNKRVEHTYSEANQCVDALARVGAKRNFPFVVFVESPLVVESLLDHDKANTFCNRVVASNI